MARGSDSAKTGATSAQNISNQSSANAGSLYGTLAPELESELANPQGINPLDLSRMDTAAEESAGGSQAAAEGAGGLLAARTRNAGGADAAIQSSARTGGQALSRGILANRLKSAEMKEGQREGAQNALGGLYKANLGTSVGALGEVANNTNADVNSQNASWNWAKYLLDPALGASSNAASAYFKG